MDINERSESGSTNQHADNTAIEGEAQVSVLEGQAEAPLTVGQPAPGETLEVPGEAGAVYLLDFDPADARITVEGQNLVLTFDSDGDGSADSRIIFLELAGMAEGSEAPVFQIAGVDYDIASLVETALAFAQERGEDAGDAGQGPTLETAGGGIDGSSQPPLGGGATQYQDNTGEGSSLGVTAALEGVGGPLGGDAGPTVSSGTVISGLPVTVSGETEVVSTPDTGSDGDGGPTIDIVSGEVVDGYIANATVFRDANNNGQLDDGEVSTITDINGNFTLVGGSGPLVAVGGTDVSTGLAFEGVLKAPEGATVITPLTTLVQQLVETGNATDAEAAETAVKEALGIDEGFDLTNTDPVEAAAGGDTAALEVVKAGIEVANTATQVQAALEGAGATDTEAASDAAFQAIAEQIADEGSGTDLSDTTQVTEVLNQASTNHDANTGETTTFDGNDVANATEVIATTNAVVEQIVVDENSDPTEVLTDLAQVAQVAQEEAAEAIEQAVETNDDTANDAFDSEGEVQTEADNAEVGDVDGADTLTEGDDDFTGDGAIDGLGGNDTLTGGTGSDAISGGAGNDVIDGDGGNDVLSGGAGNDSIDGGAGNDDIVGGPGNDTIDGGSGTDIVRYDADVGGFTFAGGGEAGEILITETASGDTDLVTNVENIAFTDSNVLLVGAGQPFASIQDAIDAAEAGDTILVEEGDYGPITIDKSLTLLAISDEVRIDGAGVNQGAAVRIESGVDDVTLGGPGNGFMIGTLDGDLAAVYVVGANEDVVIEGNTLYGGSGHALLTGGQIDGLTVRGNDLSGEGPAAVAYNNGEASLGSANASSGVRFIDNTFTGGDNAGLLLGVEADDAVITGNTFTGTASFGLLEIFGEDATITGNTFDGQGFVPAIRDSFDNYDDDALVAANTFSGGAITVLSPSASVTIDADQLPGTTELDVSSLSAAAVTFTSLGDLTQITTSAGQSVQLDGSQIAAAFPNASPLATDQTLTIVGDAAVDIVNANLTLPNDGSAPTVNNLLALEFEGLADQNSLVPENLTIDGSHAAVFAAFWIHLDASYVSGGDFLNLPVNTDFAHLGNDYVRYLNAGGEALLDLVKVPDGRQQTLHDNLLGNLMDSSISSRFTNLAPDAQPDPRTTEALEFGDRPYHDGSVDGDGLYDSADDASSTVGWDLAHGITYPADLPAPYGVLDGANTLLGGNSDEYFFGGGGNDTINGDDGEDTASYRGERSDFEIVATADGGFTLTDSDTADGDEGSDTLSQVENIQFSDGTLRFGATLARAVPEVGDGNDGFHPGSGNSDVNFVVHDNTETKIEVAIKAKVRFEGDTDSEGITYDVETGHTAGSTTGAWNFDYSIVDYGTADISADNYTISIVADFTDIHGNVTEDFMVFDPIAHRAATSEDYYQDASGGTDGLQNSQNIGWYAAGYDATTPGSYDFVLTVRDADTGEILAETQMRVDVAPNIIVDAAGNGDYTTIQEAVDNANEGDTILVLAGDYAETVTIGKQVTLLGVQTGVDPTAGARGAEATLTGAIILQDGADGTKIDGLTVAAGGDIGGNTAGIFLAAGATDITIANNIVAGNDDGARGILTTSGGSNSGLTVSQNSFSGWATGIYINPGATNAEVSGNTFNANNVGVSVDGPDGASVTGNVFTNNAFEALGLGPVSPPGSVPASLEVTLTGNNFGDSNGGDSDGRTIGVWVDGLQITTDAETANTALELQPGISSITLLGDGDIAVTGNDDANDIEGNDGNNLLDGGNGADVMDGGNGDDTLNGGIGNDDLAGEAGADLLYGGEGQDTLYGDGGADTLIGGAGNDVLYGDTEEASYSTDFSDFDLGPITDGENDWALNGNAARDQEVVDLGGERGHVFRMSSDPTSGDFAGPYSASLVDGDGEALTVGEPQTSADFDTIRISYDFRAVSDSPDSSRLEVDFSRAGNTDRKNFMVLEWDDSVGLRIAVNEPTSTNNEWANNDFAAFTGNRTLVEGLDLGGAEWHQLEMVLRFVDGADNDVIDVYLDGSLIGTTTTFENYRDWLNDDHAANAEANLASGLFFRPGNGGGAAEDGPGGGNQGFYFDNVNITAWNEQADSLSGGAGNDTLYGGAGDDTLSGGIDNDEADGGAGNDLLFGDDGSDTMDGGAGNDTLYGGDGSDDLAGDDGSDVIFGGEGNDTLFGDAGADTLIGGDGVDSLVGGAGGDTFAYEALVDAGDVIDGFDGANGDRIDLDALLDSLGVAEDAVERAGRVEIQQNASGENATISIDSNGDASFDTVLVTVTNVTGDLNTDSLILSTS